MVTSQQRHPLPKWTAAACLGLLNYLTKVHNISVSSVFARYLLKGPFQAVRHLVKLFRPHCHSYCSSVDTQTERLARTQECTAQAIKNGPWKISDY